MTKLEETVIKSQKLYKLLPIKLRNELIRAITTNTIEEILPKQSGSHYGNHGRLYAISDTKRQKIFKSILESDSFDEVITFNSKHMRHMDTVVFKVMFDIMKKHLRTNTAVIEKYPEYFI